MSAKPRIIAAGAVLAVLVLAISFAAPRRTEGTVAAAVQVMNSYVPAEVENSSRTRFETLLAFDAANFVAEYPTPIPAGKRLVIDFVSGTCGTTPSSSVIEIFLFSGPGAIYSHAFVPVITGAIAGPTYAFSQPTHIYVESGETFEAGGGFVGQGACNVYVTGFLVNA